MVRCHRRTQMNTNMKKIRDALYAFLLGALPLGTALADDIEIYVGSDTEISGVRPNILFVLDTSGSMDTNVVTQIPYDASVTYTGECSDDYYYAAESRWDESCDDAQRIPKTLFLCKSALKALESIGYYQDRLAQWRDDKKKSKDWYWTSSVSSDDRMTECEDDAGEHGKDDASTDRYPADGNDGPYTSNTKDDIDWRDYDVHTIFSANYLRWKDDHSRISQTRISIMQEVFKNTLDSINNVNVGLMRFDSGADGGMVVHEVANLSTARDNLKAQIDAMSANGNTPLSETLYEAGLYYMGKDVYYGNSSSPVKSVSGARDGSNYKTPMEFQCQKNFIVYLTDGEPTSDTGADSLIRKLPGNGKYCSGNCMDEMAEYLYEKDLNSSLAGTQNVITYTIGFATDQDLLSDAARKGGGKYYTADDTAQLTSALTNIVAEVLSVNTTFTAPAVSVNAFNRTVHLDQLFFTIFKPNERPHWDGNLKRFDLGKLNATDTTVQILDNSSPKKAAVDPNTGFFKEDARSYWTNDDQAPDGGEAKFGGAAGDIVLPRDVYTYLGNADLDDPSNKFHEDTTAITKDLLGITAQTDAYRVELMQWARGVDLNDDDDDGSTDDGRRVMGDPLHSKPVVVTYGGDSDNPDFTVFMSTNDGYLHAVNAATGAEHFTFIPKEMFGNLDKLYVNNAGKDSKVYGLDSPITAWVKDVDNDGVIESADGDRVYIYFGQRRGGKNYYALDVTDRENPQFLWQINDSSTGFGELAQTWSQPRVAKINVNGTVTDVLIFGGGYDEDQDVADNYVADDEGRAIFIVEALTGKKIWQAGPAGSGADLVIADMKNSIPSEIRVIDMNSDGLHDRMYVGDTGGRVFRFDIINGKAVADLVTGGKIASLGAGDMATPATLDNRKFFYAPDAALIVDGPTRYINLAIGSGNQNHPLGKVTQDRLFSVRDWHVYDIPTYDADLVVETADLHDATDNLAEQGDASEKEVAIKDLADSDGWFIDLENPSAGTLEGEKSLSEASTIQGAIFYTTFTPVSATQSNSCAPSQGVARAYLISARTGGAVQNFDGIGTDDELTREDRAMNLTRGGIPPEVTILFPESADGQPIALVGPEQLPVDLMNIPVRTYWYEAGAGGSE